MKKSLFFTLLVLTSTIGYSQSKIYTTTSIEFILSFSHAKINGNDVNTVPRFTGFFHLEEYRHCDFSKHIGMYSGLAIRNVGFNRKDNDSTSTILRTYTLGLPLAFKIGNLEDGFYAFAGIEAELPFHFKQKDYIHDDKVGLNQEWFSNRTQRIWPSAFVGVHFSGGMVIRFKYYLTDFYNKSYTEYENGLTIHPYANTQSQVYYISAAFFIKNRKYKPYNKNEKTARY